LVVAKQRTGTKPHALDIEDLDVETVTAFLDHLERDRGHAPRTGNARLAAIRSLYHYAALRHPEHAATIARVLAIPTGVTIARSSTTSTTRKPRRCSPPPTKRAGSAAAITPC
jgi:hypothetical protein